MRLDKRSAFFQPPSTNGRQRLAAEITPIRLNGQKRVHQDDGDNRPWPDLDLDLAKDDRKSPPPFDEAVFSPALLEWASRTAEDCSAPIDFVSGALIGGASAALGNVRRVSPWPGWVEHPFLWVALVGLPSSGKTPALAPFKAALIAVEREAMPDHAAALRRWAAQREEAALRSEAWKKEVKAAVDRRLAAPDKPKDAEAPDEPAPPRIIIVDATTEEAVNLLSQNPRGLTLLRSELSGWIGQLDRYGGAGADRAFYLEAWDGGPHTNDRVKHNGKPVRVRYNSLAIIGGLQPDKLRSVFSGPDDGLAERFAYIWPNAVPPQRPNSDGARSREAFLIRIFRRLRSLDWARDGDGEPIPKIIRVDAAGLNILDVMRNEIASAEQREPGIMACWRGKNPGRLLRLAITLEFLEWAAGDGPEPEAVSLASMQRAADYIDYLDAMMRRALGELALLPEQKLAARVARMIIAECPATLNERSLYQGEGFRDLRDKEFREKVFAELEGAGWARRQKVPTGGRPRGDWEINPQLLVER